MEVSPEANFGPLVRILWHQFWGVFPAIIDVLENNKRLRNGFPVVKKHRYLLVDRVVVEE